MLHMKEVNFFPDKRIMLRVVQIRKVADVFQELLTMLQ